VILSNFRRTRTVPYRTKLKLFFKNSLGTFDVPYYRTIIKNLELFLKTRIFRYEFYESSRESLYSDSVILWYFFKKPFLAKNLNNFQIFSLNNA